MRIMNYRRRLSRPDEEVTRVLKALDLTVLYIFLCIKVALVRDPAAGTYTFLPDVYDSFWHDIELYRDGEGTVFAVLSDGQIFRADGKTVLTKGKYELVRNCDYGYVTNGYVCANDEKGAAVISVSTGEETARFDGYYWLRYDGECMIYPDGTASIGGEMEDGYINGYPTRIVGLDGGCAEGPVRSGCDQEGRCAFHG